MISFHKLVQRDASRALARYDLANAELGSRFWKELLRVLDAIELNPGQFHFDSSGLRRANLKTFPYHILYFEELAGARVVAVRHHRQNPRFGIRRR